jgi:drug/metabolite transporter (DMT)-like permease
LFLQLSLIFVAIWGFAFWGQKISLIAIMGIVLCIVSLSLCLIDGKKEGKEKITLKWLVFALMGLIGCGGCAVAQRTQQMNFNGDYGNMLMVFGMAISLVFSLVVYFKQERKDGLQIIKSYSVAIPLFDGVFNFLYNLFVILLATSILSSTVIYPVIAVGALALSSIFSVVFFKEKLRWWQWLGMIVGAGAVVLLSI